MERIDDNSQRREEFHAQEAAVRSRWRNTIIVSGILLLVYPLSLGPYTYLDIRGFLPAGISETGHSTLYAPLWKYSRSETLFANSYEQYLQWWAQKALTEQMKNVRQL